LIYAVAGVFPGRFRWARRSADEVGLVGLAWFLGTYLPFVALSLLESRTSYLYYMVIVMPGIYVAAAQFVARVRPSPRLISAWIVTIAIAVVVMYPFTPVP
jgi:hypothetical protein